MPYEYLVVLYPSQRRVKLNNEFTGQTNTVLEVEGGQYDVTLGPPENFAPQTVRVDLRNTSALMPRTVMFAPAQASSGGDES